MVNFTSLLVTALTLGVATAAPKPGKRGFVQTDGTRFTLDGKDFTYAGTNAYYLPFYNVRSPFPPLRHHPSSLTPAIESQGC